MWGIGGSVKNEREGEGEGEGETRERHDETKRGRCCYTHPSLERIPFIAVGVLGDRGVGDFISTSLFRESSERRPDSQFIDETPSRPALLTRR